MSKVFGLIGNVCFRALAAIVRLADIFTGISIIQCPLSPNILPTPAQSKCQSALQCKMLSRAKEGGHSRCSREPKGPQLPLLLSMFAIPCPSVPSLVAGYPIRSPARLPRWQGQRCDPDQHGSKQSPRQRAPVTGVPSPAKSFKFRQERTLRHLLAFGFSAHGVVERIICERGGVMSRGWRSNCQRCVAWESRKQKGRDSRSPCQRRETRRSSDNRKPPGFRGAPH